MREHKFRGLDINGLWAYGLLSFVDHTYATKNKPKGYYICNAAGSPFAYHVRWETVGEYTGLKDKNGKEIYEGDTISNKLITGKVIYKDGCFKLDYYSKEMGQRTEPFCFIPFCTFEIIGNIHESPDKLNG